MDEHYEDTIALMIVSNKHFANAYQLCKILSWKFGIIGCSEVIKRLEEKGYVTVTYPEAKTLKFFQLTVKGEEILKEQKMAVGEYLKVNFQKEINFIQGLLGS